MVKSIKNHWQTSNQRECLWQGRLLSPLWNYVKMIGWYNLQVWLWWQPIRSRQVFFTVKSNFNITYKLTNQNQVRWSHVTFGYSPPPLAPLAFYNATEKYHFCSMAGFVALYWVWLVWVSRFTWNARVEKMLSYFGWFFCFCWYHFDGIYRVIDWFLWMFFLTVFGRFRGFCLLDCFLAC